MKAKGQIFIVSAPSGSGKTTLLRKLLEEDQQLSFSVSHTTRKPRGRERNGKEYFFVSEADFEAMIGLGQFLEYARVFDNYYGTSRRYVEECIAAGTDLLLDIDTDGAVQVKKQLPEAVSIFILPPSFQALKQRLEKRHLDSVETIRRRLEWASRKEIYQYRHYDYVVVNDLLSQSHDRLRSIVQAERCRQDRSLHQIETILKSFGGDSIDR
jgi:guanylate kinase